MLHARRKRRGPGRSGDVIGRGLGCGCDSPPTRPRHLPRGTATYVHIRILNEHCFFEFKFDVAGHLAEAYKNRAHTEDVLETLAAGS